ncbi:VrrA/YqfQ family protein [Peribacillus deserti]|nr:VrrA/YqfQ family protein [Peribacillus deserti]
MPPRQPQSPFGPGPFGPNPYRMGVPGARDHYPPMPGQRFQGGNFPNLQAPVRNNRRPKNRGGGLISKLFGGSKGPAPRSASPFSLPNRAAEASSGGIIQSLTQGGGLAGILNNTQKVLNTVQQVGPLVEQYGPLVKNLPAMWKLYRGLKSSETASEKESKKENTELEESAHEDGPVQDHKGDREIGTGKDIKPETGISRPKIFF